jgi:molybdopterin-binding protein
MRISLTPHPVRHNSLLQCSSGWICLVPLAPNGSSYERNWAGSRLSPVERSSEVTVKLSARNQLPATVVGITSGEAIANVELDVNGLRVVASITVEAVRELGLQEGTDVTAVVKASDVMVALAD